MAVLPIWQMDSAMIPWLVAAAALLVALAAMRQARRIAKRLDHVSQMYWDLKYEQGELRALIRGQAGGRPAEPVRDEEGAAAPSFTGPAPEARSSQAFIPLATLKR